MIKRIAQILFIIFSTQLLYAQQKVKIDLTQTKHNAKNVEQIQKRSNGFILSESIATIDLIEENTKEGIYGQLVSEGMSKTYDEGNPDLPVINRLIEIPENSDVKVKVLSYDEELIDLKKQGFTKHILPAQPSYSKSTDLKDVPFIKNEKVYNKNEFFKKDLVKFEDVGYLRDKHLGYIEISPFIYNPVSNILKVLNNIEIEVSFVPSVTSKINTKSNLKSPYFSNINYNTINQTAESKSLIAGPVKYVIVADRMFEETLQDFILWKTQKGFNVIEAYTDEIGTTATEIKSYLQDLYENPSDGVSPTFVLLVGDVAQIPTFDGTTGSHKTDLYYFEYTGDKLPEVFYGRFSAESVEELQPQIDKTLEIEKYEMPDPSYLDNVVLVAGVDGTYAPTYGNGAINYANDYYTNSGNGINSYYYLYGDASGVMASNNSGASASIRSYISAGVSFSNYTAHCGVSGWSDPSFNTSHIDALTNDHMYPLIIGNCCQSNTFNSNDCFGEKLLMAPNKGAVGYIGGSDYTYWDEDYYWGIGLTSTITANPTYENSELGAYDRFFHLNGEAKADWYVTQGQINVAGNLAVQASTSTRKAYYWEIYHLMGDPSLTPYITVPSAIVASYNDEIVTGSSSLEVTSEENAYVALSKDSVLLDAQLVDASGVVTLNFDAQTEVGSLNLVITKQNRQPIIDQITVKPAATPYVILDDYSIDDTAENNNSSVEYGETINLDVQLLNLSDTYDAFNVEADLVSNDTNVVITDNNESFGTILRADSMNIASSYTINFKNKFKDQQIVKFTLEIVAVDSEGTSYSWNSNLNLVVNAPELKLDYLYVDDISGDNDSIIDPGEDANIFVKVTNTGSAGLNNLDAIMELYRGTLNIDITSDSVKNVSLAPETSDTLQFAFSVKNEEKVGSFADFRFRLSDNLYKFYVDTLVEEVVFGELQKYKIDTLDADSVDTQILFYDSGGKYNDYTNYEDDSITFYPATTRGKLEVEFYSFDVEPNGSGCYDYLEIYDGENTNAELIGSFCNADKPTQFLATNDKGALTFRFYSDQSVVESGWEARISNTGNFVRFIVGDLNGAVENAVVEFNNEVKVTNSDGEVTFSFVSDGEDLAYNVRKENYANAVGNLNITKDTTLNLTIENGTPGYNVTFSVSNNDKPIYNTEIVLDEDTLYTNSEGIATFNNVLDNDNIPYRISKIHFDEVNGSLDMKGGDVLIDTSLNYTSYQVVFNVKDGANPLEGVSVTFNNEVKTTNSSGECSYELIYCLNEKYYVSKAGFIADSGMINVDENKTVDVTMQQKSYNVTFVVTDESSHVIEGVLVEFNSESKYTESNGMSQFSAYPQEEVAFTLSKDGFWNYDSTLNVGDEDVVFNAVMSSTTGISGLEAQKLKIYPNPSGGLFNVEISDANATNYQIKVFDVIGSVVYTNEIQSSSFVKEQIDISQKPKGIYFLSVKADDGSVISKRIIIK